MSANDPKQTSELPKQKSWSGSAQSWRRTCSGCADVFSF